MRAIILTSLTSLAFLAFLACEAGPAGGPEGRSPTPEPAATARPVPELPFDHPPLTRDPPRTRPVTLGAPEAADLHPTVEVTARPRRRLDLDQLRASMLQVSGGIGWTEQRGAVEVDLFRELSATLGKPDYLQTTTEDLEPSALFLKFLDDASRSVCARMVVADLDRDPADRVLLRHVAADGTDSEDAVTENLRWLVRRFHGRQLAEDGPALATWAWLHTSAEFTARDPMVGWQAVCVGLFTHPDFYSY